MDRYSEWLEEKGRAAALHRSLELEQQRLKEEELREKKERSDAAFLKWLEKSSSRAKPNHHTYAKCDGMLTGKYHYSCGAAC